MRDTLVELLEKTDLAIALCQNVVSADGLESFAQASRNIRARLSYPEDVIVAALAGGTGSGKSSILNAIADEEISDVGGVRPTTSTPLAVVAPASRGFIDGYLSELGIETKSVAAVPEWMVLIDLPDTDSVEVNHLHQVEALLPRVDVVVWVTDPEKYRDAVLHDRFLKPLAVYAPQLLFALNQSDRVAGEALPDVLADFAVALREDGIEDPHLYATAANPASGPPEGVDDLVSALATLNDSRVGLYAKLLTDLERAVTEVQTLVGEAGVDFDRRFGGEIGIAAELVVNGNADAATSTLTRFVKTLATDAGGPVGEDVGNVAVDIPGVVQTVREALAAAAVEHRSTLPPIRWSEKGDSMSQEAKLALAEQGLTARLKPPIREALSLRAKANGALADLSLALTSTASSWR